MIKIKHKILLAIIILPIIIGITQLGEKEIEGMIYKKPFLIGKTPILSTGAFVKVNQKYIGYNKTIYLLKPVYEKYQEMYDSAIIAGVELNIISGYRSWEHQKIIWENKWTGKTKIEGFENAMDTLSNIEKSQLILKYSAMPGLSRHHWGTDIDLIAIEDSLFKEAKNQRAYEWLQNNAFKYGFCQTYTKKDSIRPTGFEEEKWHWTYFPISEKIINSYREMINYSDISGFKGSYLADSLKVIEQYVFGINKECGLNSVHLK